MNIVPMNSKFRCDHEKLTCSVKPAKIKGLYSLKASSVHPQIVSNGLTMWVCARPKKHRLAK